MTSPRSLRLLTSSISWPTTSTPMALRLARLPASIGMARSWPARSLSSTPRTRCWASRCTREAGGMGSGQRRPSLKRCPVVSPPPVPASTTTSRQPPRPSSPLTAPPSPTSTTPTASLARSRWSEPMGWPGSPPGGSASKTRPSGRPSSEPCAARAGSALRRAGLEVGKVELVHPVADLGQPLLALGVGLAAVTFTLCLGQHARLLEHLAGHENAGAQPHRYSDRVRGPGVDLQGAPIDAGQDARVKHLIVQRRDHDAVHNDVDRAEHVGEQVMSDRPFRSDAGDLQRDGVGLVDPDPDGQISLGGLFLEDHHVLPGGHVHPD